MKSKLPVILIVALFAILTVIYFRYVIWSPADTLLTRHLASDLYGHFMHVWMSLKLLGQGIIPIGDYWVQLGGGYPAALHDQLLLPQDFLLMIFYVLTGSFTLALKLANITFYFTTLVCAYWLGKVIFKRRDISVVLAVAYAFSAYGVNQLEHPELLCVHSFILLTVMFLEKTLQSGKPLYMILTGLSLLSVWSSQPYPFYFLTVFIGLRLIFQLATTPHRLETLYTFSKIGVLSLLMITPFLLPALNKMPSEQFAAEVLRRQLPFFSQPPSLYFLRTLTFKPNAPEIQTMYLGLSVLILALVPACLRQTFGHRKLYIFHLLTATLFCIYAIGHYGPVNLASWFSAHMPFAFFIRVPGRALVIGHLSLSICAAIGLGVVLDKVKQLRWKRIAPPIVTLGAVLIIFADLTVGFEPPTMVIPPTAESAYQFIEEQPGDFRIMEIPSTHGQQSTTPMCTGHDTANKVPWAFGHFEPLLAFREVYLNYLNLSITAQEAALYGTKYVIVNMDPKYFDAYRAGLNFVAVNLAQVQGVDGLLSDSDDYKLVYNEGRIKVYENLMYRGMAFSNETDVRYERKDTNTLIIEYDSATPTVITVSQSFADGWVAILDDGKALPVYEFKSVQQIKVPAGQHNIVLHYQNYERWFVILAACYIVLVGVIVGWVWKPWHEHN